ncbi:MAG: TonB-dependent receptor family protein [Muribaculaceae bacterium]|nr:TonB-dependent receptor family protein [Muribaculaceae bacterium]
MNKRIISLLSVSLLAVATLIAATVKGKIVDSQGQPLIGATATLLALPDSTIITGLMTDAEGAYLFKDLKPRRYAIKASMIGMDTEITDFTVADTTKTIELPILKLYDESTVLKELLVKGVKAAVVAKEDTIEYNADSFHTTENAMVEDLLKKMPGMEVGKDGSITANGKTVSKILINGKEAYGDDPSMATKNYSAKVISKVQVVDRKSEQARLTGVDDGEDETVINLTIKKGMENSWFGNVKLGYGTDRRYAESFSVTNMNDGNRVTINGLANNINERGGRDMGGSFFGMGGGNGGILTAQQLGVDFAIGNEETLAVGGFVRYDHGDRTQENSSETMNLLPDSVSYQTSTSGSRDKNHDINAFFRARWNPNENNTFDFRPSFSYSFRNTTSNSESHLFAGDAAHTAVNSQINDRINRGNNWTARGELTYVHRFSQKKGRSFSVRGEYSFTNNRQHMVSLSEIAKYLMENEDEDLFRYTDNKSWNNNVSARLTWTEPIGRPGNFLEFAYNINSRKNNTDKYVYNLPMDYYFENNYQLPFFDYVPIGGEMSDSLSNSFRNDFLTQSIRFGYVYTNKDMNLNAGIELVPSSSKSTDLIMSERNIPRRNVINFAPFIRFRYKFSKTRSMHLRYNARSSEPSISQLQPVADVSDPMNIRIGNPNLKPTFTQRFNGMFRDFDMENQRSIFAMLNGSYTINNIVSKTTTNNLTGARETTYTNTSGDFSISGMGRIDQPLRNRNWRISANLNASYSNKNSYTNGLYNRSGSLNLHPRVGMTFSTEIVQISVTPNYAWQLATSTLANQPNRNNSSYGFDSDFTLDLPFGLQMGTSLNYSKTEGLSAGYDSSSWIWNANILYTIPGTYGLNIFAEAHDILGDTKNISRSVSAAAIVDNRYNNLTRYFMFGLSWRFNSSTWKKKKGEDLLDGDMPMPGPGMMEPGGRGGQRPMGPPPGGFGGGRPF